MIERRTQAFLAILMATAALPARAVRTPEEDDKLTALAGKISGTVLFTQGGRAYTMVIGDWTPVDRGEGTYARWSPDGQQIAVYHLGPIYVMDADGGNRQEVFPFVLGQINPIDFHANGVEIVFTQYMHGLMAVGTGGGAARDVATYHEYYGEPSVSTDGKRMAARKSHYAYAVQVDVGDRQFASGACSPGVSPDGARLMNNIMAHDKLLVRDWDGSNLSALDSTDCLPDGTWDNHHWSNHPDYIAVQGDTVSEIYVLQVSTNEITRVTWLGDCLYADLHVESVLSISGTITDVGAGAPAANRIVKATGVSETISTQTNELGEYMIIGLLGGSYDISAPGYDLTPTDPVIVSGADVTGADFDATAQDTDTDLLDDPWEFKFFGDLTSTDGSGDADSDGKTDKQEYDAGTNPTLDEAAATNGDDKCGAVGSLGALLALAPFLVALRRRAYRGA